MTAVQLRDEIGVFKREFAEFLGAHAGAFEPGRDDALELDVQLCRGHRLRR